MKLYYSPGSCALAPHIVALEAGIPLELVKVDLSTKTVKAEGDYWAINPKGYVPALELDDGERLTEGPAIMQYLADLKPASRLAPASGTFERVRLQEMLNYITSEIHKTYSPLFNPDVLPEVIKDRLAYLRKRYAFLEKHLEGRNYLLGEQISVADFYLFAVTRWARGVKLDLREFPRLEGLQKRIGSRKSALQAMREEGLIPEDKAA